MFGLERLFLSETFHYNNLKIEKKFRARGLSKKSEEIIRFSDE